MSAPGLGKPPRLSLPDLGELAKLPKPLRALAYLGVLAVFTAVGVAGLLLTILIIGQLTGAFPG